MTAIGRYAHWLTHCRAVVSRWWALGPIPVGCGVQNGQRRSVSRYGGAMGILRKGRAGMGILRGERRNPVPYRGH